MSERVNLLTTQVFAALVQVSKAHDAVRAEPGLSLAMCMPSGAGLSTASRPTVREVGISNSEFAR